MRREGKQHGMVRVFTALPLDFNPRADAKAVVNALDAPPTAGAFTRVPAKPSAHSKYTSKCRKARCQSCHLSPVNKAKDKTKGTNKQRSCDVLLNHRLLAWKVVDDRSLLNYKAMSSATGIVDHLCGRSLHESMECEEQGLGADVQYYHYGCGVATDLEEGGCSSGGKEVEVGISSDDESAIGDFHVVGIGWECSDGEDWLVVGEM